MLGAAWAKGAPRARAELTDMVCPTLEFFGVSYLGNILKALA